MFRPMIEHFKSLFLEKYQGEFFYNDTEEKYFRSSILSRDIEIMIVLQKHKINSPSNYTQKHFC